MYPNSFGRRFIITLFGESHGVGIGVVIDGCPAGITIDPTYIQHELNRRRPGQSLVSTSRQEADTFEIISGVLNGKTSGGPLTFLIRNSDTKSSDYDQFSTTPRPSQADYPGILRYGQSVDLRGSGHFSGRISAGIVIAGSIAKSILLSQKIIIGAYVSQIGTIVDENLYSVGEIIQNIESNIIRAVDQKKAKEMQNLIEEIKRESDSVGGKVTVQIEGFPAGIGDPWFHSLESDLAAALFSIPATRGVEFGSGFNAANMKGSEHNDAFVIKENRIETKTNHCGGIIGGISIGMPIIFRVAIKPTASIGQPQETVNLKKKENASVKIEGRHDPCIVPRICVVLEAMTAIVLLDQLLVAGSYQLK